MKPSETIPVEITPLDSSEVELLRPLVDDFVKSHKKLIFREDYWTPFRDWILSAMDDPNQKILVAQKGSQMIGLAAATIQENGPLLFPEKIGYIGLLVVSSKFRRRGVGSKLWNKLKDWFFAAGLQDIELYTEVENSDSAAFWQDRGFSTILERRRKRVE